MVNSMMCSSVPTKSISSFYVYANINFLSFKEEREWKHLNVILNQNKNVYHKL